MKSFLYILFISIVSMLCCSTVFATIYTDHAKLALTKAIKDTVHTTDLSEDDLTFTSTKNNVQWGEIHVDQLSVGKSVINGKFYFKSSTKPTMIHAELDVAEAYRDMNSGDISITFKTLIIDFTMSEVLQKADGKKYDAVTGKITYECKYTNCSNEETKKNGSKMTRQFTWDQVMYQIGAPIQMQPTPTPRNSIIPPMWITPDQPFSMPDLRFNPFAPTASSSTENVAITNSNSNQKIDLTSPNQNSSSNHTSIRLDGEASAEWSRLKDAFNALNPFNWFK